MTSTQEKRVDFLKLTKLCWPSLILYKQQREIIDSFLHNDETFVVAGNELGKDFGAALLGILFFVTRSPCFLVTTSVQSGQLEDVLWGEIRNFIETSQVALPLQYNHMKIRQTMPDGRLHPKSVLIGKVVQKGEALLGRHLPKGPNGEPTTGIIFDESSGISDETYDKTDTWAHRKLAIGNAYPCTNFYYNGVKAGNLKSILDPDRFYRKVIRIVAEDSPNVRYAFAEIKAGKKPSHKTLVPGVLSYADYLQRRELWNEVRQSIGLDAQFYEGKEVRLFPIDWLADSILMAEELGNVKGSSRKVRAIGIDPGEGAASSVFVAIDEFGIIKLLSVKTPDTSDIADYTIKMMKKYRVPASNVWMDRGGGGKQHADYLRLRGYKINTVSFGEPASPEKRQGYVSLEEYKLHKEEKTIYKNRRAQMYGLLREELQKSPKFAIPKEYSELHRQLRLIPLRYDDEGKLVLPPKNKRNPNSKELTLIEIIGNSPDEADALVIALYGMKRAVSRVVAGAL